MLLSFLSLTSTLWTRSQHHCVTKHPSIVCRCQHLNNLTHISHCGVLYEAFIIFFLNYFFKNKSIFRCNGTWKNKVFSITHSGN